MYIKIDNIKLSTRALYINNCITNIPFFLVLEGIFPGLFGNGVIDQRVYVRGICPRGVYVLIPEK